MDIRFKKLFLVSLFSVEFDRASAVNKIKLESPSASLHPFVVRKERDLVTYKKCVKL
jgi:hypothetical protein